MTTLSNHHTNLAAAWQLVQQRWEATGDVWSDQMHDHFASQHWQPLMQQTQATQRSLDRLAQIVARAERAVK